MPVNLSPAQRAELRQLLEAELRDASRAAVAAGARPEAVAEALDARRRALEATVEVPHDPVDGPDDPADHGRVRE
ncbi:hypothetical protein Asi02nite_25130 [Asanoa siamensis]|uniref:Uncharacterized protein n=1 Tax=Asanoa siamensis TaxID=926357 RepID=A0ABQ4CNY1_9ACTN|nr:hypothetical protein Asi02nite_25130 [Asanoa siamensis]